MDRTDSMKLSPKRIIQFQKLVVDFHRKNGRSFPWRQTRDPYAILVSEVMLQQTQAERVVLFFNKWMKEFPTVKTLAKAPLKKVLQAWQGLGYNRRALHLKQAAQILVGKYGGEIPRSIEKIDKLPGIGPYTAGAIAAFAFDIASPFIETNIRTVYLHFFFKGKTQVEDQEIYSLVAQTLPEGKIGEWYQALMDYGAMLKKTLGNPNTRSAGYAKQSSFRGSRRELRGAIIRHALQESKVTLSDFQELKSGFAIAEIFYELVSEGFLKKEGRTFLLV